MIIRGFAKQRRDYSRFHEILVLIFILSGNRFDSFVLGYTIREKILIGRTKGEKIVIGRKEFPVLISLHKAKLGLLIFIPTMRSR